MKQEDRRSILWLGGDIPSLLVAELRQRGEIAILATSLKNLNELAPSARGVIVEFNGDPKDYVAQVKAARNICLDHGLRIGLVRSDHSDETLFTTLIEAPEISLEELNRVKWYLLNDWPNLAEWLVRQDAGPGARPLLKIECDKHTVLDDEQRLLLRRAFHKFDTLTVKEVAGGYSGAKTYKVSAVKASLGCVQRLTPYLAKIGDIASIDQEINNYQQYAAEYIPFNHRPNLNPELIAYGQRSAIMVEDFLHEARQLSELWGVGGAGSIVESLFDSALQGWRFNPLKRKSTLADQFKALKILRLERDLRDKGAARQEAALASKSYGATMTPVALVKRIEDVPALEWHECIVHADFHAQNVFVKTASAETYVIDYSNTASGPAVIDPASLEVSLTFRFAPEDHFDRDFLLRLYQYPLNVPADDLRLPHGDCEWIWKVVRACRRHVLPGDRPAYVMAVVCCLLQAASYDNNELERRALAYYLAEQLTQDLHKDIGSGK